jgi:DNA-binding transcriptional MocR family regulator
VAGVLRGQQLHLLLGRWHGVGGRRAPEYLALAGAVRGLLTDGRLAIGVRMPAERELAEALSVSRTTISAAYGALRESGHLVSRRGAGSWTALPGGYQVHLDGLKAPRLAPGVLDLACAALPAPAELADAVAEAAGELPGHVTGAGYEPTGLAELRELVAAGYAERGLGTDPGQIMITCGVQHAFSLLLRLLVEPGQRALVETPTYPNALRALVAARARVVSYGMGTAGWDAEVLLATLRSAGARVAYLVADYHNPTGHCMDAALRERLVATAHAAGTDVIVDESFVDLRLSGPPVPPPMAAFDRASRVIAIGSMSKPYWGGLRIGWIRAPAPVVARLAEVRLAVDIASPVLDQLVAVRLLARRDTIVPARRAELLLRRSALVAALTEQLPNWRFRVPDGGLGLWVELEGPVATALARAAERLEVQVAAGPRFGVDGTLERFMRLPYTLPAGDLVEAVRRLAAAGQAIDAPGGFGFGRTAVVA